MTVVFSVLGDTRDEAQAALAELCERMGLVASGPPSEIIGRDRWMARARVAVPEAEGGPRT
jgi:hypothetical protein